MTVRIMNLVAPLSHEDTDMHIADTSGSSRDRSGAVSTLKNRCGDVKCANQRRSSRTSTTATRTTTTSTTSSASVPSADSSNYSFEDLLYAYLCCRRHKRNKESAQAINDTAQTIINTAKVEIDHMKVVGGCSGFISGEDGTPKLPHGQTQTTRTQSGTKTVTQLLPGATVTQHRIGG